jgi:hypothetical protein
MQDNVIESVTNARIYMLFEREIFKSSAPLHSAKSSPQGWTKFSRFGDLDALSEDDWDKVRPPLSLPYLTNAVLGCKRQGANGSPPRRAAHLQR